MSHSKKLAGQFWANKGPEARMRVAFSKTRGKANGWIVMDPGGEPEERFLGLGSHRALQAGVRV